MKAGRMTMMGLTVTLTMTLLLLLALVQVLVLLLQLFMGGISLHSECTPNNLNIIA